MIPELHKQKQSSLNFVQKEKTSSFSIPFRPFVRNFAMLLAHRTATNERVTHAWIPMCKTGNPSNLLFYHLNLGIVLSHLFTAMYIIILVYASGVYIFVCRNSQTCMAAMFSLSA